MVDIETEFLLAVERGELDLVRDFLSRKDRIGININCRDRLDRDAPIIALDNKNLKIIKLLLGEGFERGVEMGDALLYAIQDDFVEAVELLLDHQSSQGLHQPREDSGGSCFFSSDITPLMLAAQKNNLEIVELLLDRKVPPVKSPHDPRCGCDTCCRARGDDCLKHSRSRINAYKALASPSHMALSSADPLATAFEMSAKLEGLAKMEPEYKEEYMRLRAQCQAFATRLLDCARTIKELETLFNFEQPARLDTLKLAIQCKQKTLCAHPNIQELLATMWYEGLPDFRRKNVLNQTIQIVCIGLMFPVYSLAYLIAPHSQFGSHIKKPFIKFICHSASRIAFVIFLLWGSQRMKAYDEWSSNALLIIQTAEQQLKLMGSINANSQIPAAEGEAYNLSRYLLIETIDSPPPAPARSYGDDIEINTLAALYKHTMGQAVTRGGSSALGLDLLSRIFEQLPASSKKRDTLPSPIEWAILVWVLSLIWAELKQIRALGINYYKDDMWNILDSIASGCYIGTIILRIVSYVQSDDKSLEVARENWHAYDPALLSEGLFAIAFIFSILKLIHIFPVSPYLGPLQISLGRMLSDIPRWFLIYLLVLFAFACGMHQLLWYYADLGRHQCLNVTNYNLAQYYKAKQNQSKPVGEEDSSAQYYKKQKIQLVAVGEEDSSVPPITLDDSCKTWRHFSNVFESLQTLFWACFGVIDLENFDLTGIGQYTRFWALLMFGCFCFITVIVVLNLLLAMINQSFAIISMRSDIEWKFARTRLWVSYFQNGSTVPARNILAPIFRLVCSAWRRSYGTTSSPSVIREGPQSIVYLEPAEPTQTVIQPVVRRYIVCEQRQLETKVKRVASWTRSSSDHPDREFSTGAAIRVAGCQAAPSNLRSPS